MGRNKKTILIRNLSHFLKYKFSRNEGEGGELFIWHLNFISVSQLVQNL